MTLPFIAGAIGSSPLPWVVLAGVCVGGAVSRATRRTRPGRDPERERARRWVVVCMLLSLAVILGLAAVFLPGPSRIADTRLAWACGAAAVVSFAAFRFRKALGIPVLVLLLAFAVSLGLFLRSIRAFTGETVIATVRVIGTSTVTGGVSGSSTMNLELVPRGMEPVVLSMKGDYFAPVVKVVIFDDLLVFLGAKTWYRFEGMTSFDTNLRQQDTDYRFDRAPGISDRIWSFFEANETSIPGVKTAQVEMTAKRAKDLSSFEVRVQNDGGVEVVPTSG
jgi:hypothetical protein